MTDRNQLAEQLAQAQAQAPTSSPGTAPVAPRAEVGGSAATPPGGVALQLVKVLQQQVANLEGRLAAGEKQRKALKKVTGNLGIRCRSAACKWYIGLCWRPTECT